MLEKLEQDKVRAMVVIPKWAWSTWWPLWESFCKNAFTFTEPVCLKAIHPWEASSVSLLEAGWAGLSFSLSVAQSGPVFECVTKLRWIWETLIFVFFDSSFEYLGYFSVIFIRHIKMRREDKSPG